MKSRRYSNKNGPETPSGGLQAVGYCSCKAIVVAKFSSFRIRSNRD
ncbi:hypothetical protein L21SP2_1241 [Salinispira pacifica]|uniref:Uncharacterized protein n=1 Tax=Salinispira pacifica TaxID=1307761 RepID=V5WFQ1_9SPIO|nr:hypothetical protein L21SP2_1241 [Salinispira pacifica]